MTDTSLPEINGVTTVLAIMQQGLRDRGLEVLTVAPAVPGHADAAGDNGHVVRRPSIPCPRYPSVRLSWPFDSVVHRALDCFGPDLVHAVTEGPLGLQGRAFARREGLPFVTSYHTDFPSYASRYLGRWAVAPTTRYLTWFHRPARLTQTPSGVIAGQLRELGVARTQVWGRSVDAAAFTPSHRSNDFREELGARDRFVVLHVGRLAREKGLDTLIASFRLAHESLGSRAAFWVAGDGPDAPVVRAALPFARHLGFIARPLLARLYANADLFVFPSATETCGLVALEAMASGLPVLGAKAGGVVESVTPGITGDLIAPGDAGGFAAGIVAMAWNPEDRHAMSIAARAFASGRDWSHELDQLVGTYEGLIESGPVATGAAHQPRLDRDVAVEAS